MKKLILLTILCTSACGRPADTFDTKEEMLYEVFDAWCGYIMRCQPRIPVEDGQWSGEFCNGEFVADYCKMYDCTQPPEESDSEITYCINLYDQAVCSDDPERKPVCEVWNFRQLPR